MARLGENRNGWAWLLIAGGLALLATQLGWVGRLNDWLWALLFLGGGAAFFYHFSTSRRDWWALIPAAALAAIGVSILGGAAGGADFLGVLGIGFALVYLTGHERWWAIIPAGVLITLAVVAWTDARFPRLDTGWLFFLGLAATFTLPPGDYEAAIDTGVGAATVRLPQGVEARLRVSRGIGAVSVPAGFARDGDVYTSAGYGSARERLDISLDTGVGAVDVVRVP